MAFDLKVHSRYCEELVNSQLKECARIIKAKGALYRWRKHNAPAVLVVWDKESKTFINFDNQGFCQWLGSHFDLRDRFGVHFGLPHRATAARIWEELLKDGHGLEWASWQLTDEYRKATK
jgi:hypothetical protein